MEAKLSHKKEEAAQADHAGLPVAKCSTTEVSHVPSQYEENLFDHFEISNTSLGKSTRSFKEPTRSNINNHKQCRRDCACGAKTCNLNLKIEESKSTTGHILIRCSLCLRSKSWHMGFAHCLGVSRPLYMKMPLCEI